MVKVRVVRSHCLGGGIDVFEGQIIELDEAEALRKTKLEWVIPVPAEEPAPALPPSAREPSPAPAEPAPPATTIDPAAPDPPEPAPPASKPPGRGGNR